MMTVVDGDRGSRLALSGTGKEGRRRRRIVDGDDVQRDHFVSFLQTLMFAAFSPSFWLLVSYLARPYLT
jgi:hypothetical protein